MKGEGGPFESKGQLCKRVHEERDRQDSKGAETTRVGGLEPICSQIPPGPPLRNISSGQAFKALALGTSSRIITYSKPFLPKPSFNFDGVARRVRLTANLTGPEAKDLVDLGILKGKQIG